MERIAQLKPQTLYDFLCDKIGSEEAVKTRRTFYDTHNALTKTKTHTPFFSGSRGEGLDMKGSDTDIIIILEDILVVEHTNNDCNSNTFKMELYDDNPGFARLRLCGKIENEDVWCIKEGNSTYLSGKKMKETLLLLNKTNDACVLNTLHGPCISTNEETYDCTAGVKCKSFIEEASFWQTRDRLGSWPSGTLKNKIIKSGVLFVPVGNKLSPTSDIEWRISFSVAEKLLVFSFTHTQLLVYALLKIFLKESIEEHNVDFKDMLCSYFLKTVVFWVSESTNIVWKPHNFIKCFNICLKQIKLDVGKDNLPHYFLPENNLLKHRITLPAWKKFKSDFNNYTLYYLINASSTMKQIKSWEQQKVDVSELIQLNEVRTLLSRGQPILKTILTFQQLDENCDEFQKMENKNKLIFECLVGTLYRDMTAFFSFNDNSKDNPVLLLPFALKGENSDAISGRNVLATYYYCMGVYSQSLDTLDKVLKEVQTEEKTNAYLYYKDDKFNKEHIEEGPPHDLSKIYIRNTMEPNDFYPNSFCIPNEMKYEVKYKGYVQKPPIVYALFLRFLCLLKLKETDKCLSSLTELRKSIDSDKYIGNHVMKAECYTLLGMASYLASRLLMTETSEYHIKAYKLDGLRQIKYLKIIDKTRKEYESSD